MISKRRKLWPNRGPLPDYDNGSYTYAKDGVSQMQIDEMLPLKPKDPYEFNDEFDEESPSSSTFRARLEV